MDNTTSEFVRGGTLEELKAKGRLVVHGRHRPLLLVQEGGHVFALDNRCPHMGFPLDRGSVEDGILTCHWHHAPLLPFPHPSHRIGHADLPHPALGQDVTPSPTTGRDQAGSGVRAGSARKGARVDKLRPCPQMQAHDVGRSFVQLTEQVGKSPVDPTHIVRRDPHRTLRIT